VNRIFQATVYDKLIALAGMLYGFPTRSHMYRMHSLAVFPGYVDRVVEEAAALFVQHERLQRFFVNGGVEQSVPFYIPLTDERLRDAPFRVPRNRQIITQVFAKHTKDQTDWLADRLIEHNETSVAVVVYPFHLLRAFSTLVRSLEERNRLDILVFPVVAQISPEDPFVELQADGWTLMPGEIRRILEYRKQNGVASFETMQKYLHSLWGYIQS
jgi:hypothetical protein